MSEIECLELIARRPSTWAGPRRCYLEIPAVDPRQSAVFYEKVFGWDVRGRETDRPMFAWPGMDVAGEWTTGRAAEDDGGVLIDVRVDDVDDTLARAWTHGGEVIDAPHPDDEGGQWVGTFRDPAGNVIGVYQDAPREDAERDDQF